MKDEAKLVARIDLCQAVLNAAYGANRRHQVIQNAGGFYSPEAQKRVQWNEGRKAYTRRSVDEALKMEAAWCRDQINEVSHVAAQPQQ